MFTNTEKTRAKLGPLSPRQMGQIRGFKIKLEIKLLSLFFTSELSAYDIFEHDKAKES